MNSNKIMQWIVNPVSLTKVWLVLILLLNFPTLDGYIRVLLRVIPFWSLIIVSDKKYILKAKIEKRHWLLIAMLFSYAITIIVNFKTNFIQNVKAEMWFFIYVVVLLLGWRYANGTDMEREKDILCICKLVIGLNAVNVVPSVILYLFNIGYGYKNEPHGYVAVIGRLYGIVSGVNPSGAIAVVAMCCFFYIIVVKKKKTPTIFFWGIIHTIVNYIYILATGTRAIQIMIIVLLGFVVGNIFIMKVWSRTDKMKISVKNIFVCVACYAVALTLFATAVHISREPVSMLHVENVTIKSGIETIIKELGGEIVDNSDGTLVRTEESKISSSVHRFNIWTECIELWTEHPIWGIGAANTDAYANMSEKNFKYINIGGTGASAHGMPVAVLLYSGIIGTFIFMLFMIIEGWWLLKNIYRMMMCGRMEFRIIIPVAICCVLLIYSVFGTIIIFSNVQCTVLFWIFLGIAEYEQRKFMRKGLDDAEKEY